MWNNHVMLVGHIGKDPILRHTGKGTACLNFTVATLVKNKSAAPTTTWHECVAWDKQAEDLLPHLEKGTPVVVIGNIHKGSYEKAGQRIYFTQIYTESVFKTVKTTFPPKYLESVEAAKMAANNEEVPDDVPF